jgi:hypothetical protein
MKINQLGFNCEKMTKQNTLFERDAFHIVVRTSTDSYYYDSMTASLIRRNWFNAFFLLEMKKINIHR